MSIMEDLIEDLENLLEDAEGPDGVDGQSGPLTEPNKSYVDTRLTDSLAKIAHALSVSHLANAGTADIDGWTWTLPWVADKCLKEAGLAKASSDDDFIASRLKSIEAAVNRATDGYKGLAGIT